MKHKEPEVAYENFSRAFADVFLEHAHDLGAFHTCYVRTAILRYVVELPEERAIIMEEASREELVGFIIADNLLRCGWPKDDIIWFVQQQQGYVDAMEDADIGFIGVLNAAGYWNEESFLLDSNGVRYSWLLDGAPDLQNVIDELNESNSYDDDDDGEWW